MVTYLDEAAVRAALRWDDLIAAMENALTAFSAAVCCSPFGNGHDRGREPVLGHVPAVGDDAMGVKLVSFYPRNAGTGVPTVIAMVFLSTRHGRTDCVLDGRTLTAMHGGSLSSRYQAPRFTG
jgi:thiomorpholine-carboxylate dehydrogenase